MNTAQHENKENKTTNTQLRRNAMNAKKLTLVALSAAAIIIGGCSRDNRITAPDNAVMEEEMALPMEFDTQIDSENSAARIAIGSFDQKIERDDFVVTVKKSEVEGGCWYLEDVKFVRYTPYFENNAPKLYVGQRLHVFGYIDENMSSYCMIGSVFHIEKYKILSRGESRLTSEMTTEIVLDFAGHSAVADANIHDMTAAAAGQAAADDADAYDPAAGSAGTHSDLTTLKGYYFSNDEGCIYISDRKEIIAELHFTWLKLQCPNIQNGTLIAVQGEYSLLTWSPCQLAPLFNVEKFKVLEENHVIAKDGRAGK
jgi:hypothetical protein